MPDSPSKIPGVGRVPGRGTVRCDVPLFDDWLGGLREGGAHVVTGGSGSGKSSIALHFVHAGIRRGESVAMLIRGRASDVRTHARHLGVDLDTAIRDGRLLLIRYRTESVSGEAHQPSPAEVIADLDRIVSAAGASRIAIDTISPLVDGSTPAGSAATALALFLERSGATSLLTFPEDLADDYDRRLEPLVQSAAAIIRLVRETAEVRRAEVVTLRYPPPLAATLAMRFVIREYNGVVAERPGRAGERVALRVP